MTKKRTFKGLLTALLSLAMAVAMSVNMFASAADTVTETVVITQVIEKGTEPKQKSYTYWLTPEDESYPLPSGLKSTTPNEDGKYEVGTITGNSTDKTALTLTFTLDKTQEGTYVYYLEKTPKTPAEDTFSPTQQLWKFGFRIKEDNNTGKLVALTPELCVGGETELSETGEDGFPTKLTLINGIKGTATTAPSTKPSTKPSTNPSTRSTTSPYGYSTRSTTYYSGRTTSTKNRASWVNTGDESNLIMWVVILGVAVLGLLIVLLLRKRRDDDDGENI